MARPHRPNIAGASYHVMARGIRREAIYLDDEDRGKFLRVLGDVARRYGWECLAYCLMDNHYHAVVRTPQPNLSLGMRFVNGAYATAFNARYGRDGHLFQGRFRSVLIRSSGHLRIAIRYVLRNPVAARLCTDPTGWPWSSYEATLSTDGNGLVSRTAALAWFDQDGDARDRFVRFIGADDITASGDDALFDDVELPCAPGLAAPRPALEDILTQLPGAAGIAHAHGHHGYTFTEIALALGLSTSAVGRLLVAYEADMMRTASTWPRAD